MQRLLLTRPEPDNAILDDALTKHGIQCLHAPLLCIRRLPFTCPPEQPDAILLTSRHAAFACVGYADIPVYAVGEQTAAAAQNAGVRHIAAVAHDMQALQPHLQKAGGNILYFSGKHVRHEVSTLVPAARITRICVYEAEAAKALPESALEALRQHRIDGVAFYSPRSAQLFHHLVPDALHGSLVAYCLSAAVAENCTGWRKIAVAEMPTQQAMIQLLTSRK